MKELPESSLLGEFSVHAAPVQMDLHRSPRTCGRIMTRDRAIGLPRAADAEPHDPKPVYASSILANDSRALLAGVLSPRQDLPADLLVLRAARHQYGATAALVRDGGPIVRANQARASDEESGIDKVESDKGQPREDGIETLRTIMQGMAEGASAQGEARAGRGAGCASGTP